MDELEFELKTLIVETLKLEDITPQDIDSGEALFVDGLGLDSIDALELGVALRKRYGIRIETVDKSIRAHFANVGSLARFVRAQSER
jgi:acyl carrier protein